MMFARAVVVFLVVGKKENCKHTKDLVKLHTINKLLISIFKQICESGFFTLTILKHAFTLKITCSILVYSYWVSVIAYTAFKN